MLLLLTVNVTDDTGDDTEALNTDDAPDTVVVGWIMTTLLTMSIAVARSPRFRMYAHVNFKLAPGSNTGNR